MNKNIEQIYRQRLKDELSKLSPGNHMLFKRMYSPKNMDADIDSVVDSMPVDKLDWAMTQVDNTVSEL